MKETFTGQDGKNLHEKRPKKYPLYEDKITIFLSIGRREHKGLQKMKVFFGMSSKGVKTFYKTSKLSFFIFFGCEMISTLIVYFVKDYLIY